MSLVKQARESIKAGEKRQARLLLQQALREKPDDYAAWLWLASITPSPSASYGYVQRAQKLRPNDPRVRKAMAWAEKRVAQTQVVEEAEAPQVEIVPVAPVATSTNEETPSRPWQTAVMRISLALLALILVVTAVFYFRNIDRNVTPETTVAEIPILSSEPIAEPTATAEPVQPTATPEATATSVHAKNIVQGSDDPRPTWTVTPTPSPTPSPTPTIIPTFTSDSGGVIRGGRPLGVAADERWIDVDLSTQTLRAFEGNELIFETLISSGLANTPTVTGQFRIWLRYESQTMDGSQLGYDYYLENVPYVMYFYEDYALHGAYWHSNFGTPMSHGCVNMDISDAQWVYSWAGEGTVVNVHY